MKKGLIWLCIACFMLPMAVAASPEEANEGYYTVHHADGGILLRTAGEVNEGDEYISCDNKRYRVTQVDATAMRAVAVYVEDVTLPEVALPAQNEEWVPRVALYCTHSAESYIEGDGTESIDTGGGILDVAALLTQELNRAGCEAVLDETNHVPHDAGAYRRSRKTASALMREEFPALLLDIHRDAVPEDEYLQEVEGEEITSVRIVVGRGNTNYPVNEELAQTIKSIADVRYPGLIKDIYLGKGDYNQDLMPRSLLLEFGSHETSKAMAEKSTQYLSEVIAVTLGAEKTEMTAPEATGKPAPEGTMAPQDQGETGKEEEEPAPQDESVGNSPWKSIGLIAGILALIGGGVLVFFVRSGQKGESAGHFFRELTGMGRRPDEDREERK